MPNKNINSPIDKQESSVTIAPINQSDSIPSIVSQAPSVLKNNKIETSSPLEASNKF
jgi:hypothetical protein